MSAATATPKTKPNVTQVPKFADKIANVIAAHHDRKKKHVIAAALLAFNEIDADAQDALIKNAISKFNEGGESES